ncbi:MAG TPA: amino acid adenylation domain-containing protein [Verrucomicrobiae bacterium]|nr:amino acid adenylation domain-containing protein [Verrucomicrobiae bacterium]
MDALAWQIAQNRTATDYPFAGGLIPLFEAAAATAPEHPAVVFENEVLTYGVFNQRVNRLAHRLRAMGCGRDRLVGLCLDRSLDLPTAVWAVLKAGGAYVPLAVDDPDLRLKELIDDAGLEIVLCDAASAPRLRPLTRHVVIAAEAATAAEQAGHNPLIEISGDQLAYTIFTSGSTGRPKGVMIEHAAIHNRIVWMQDRYRLGPMDRILQKTPYTFDVSVWEFLWPFIAGATLVVARPGGHRSPNYLVKTMRDQKVTCAHFVPSMLRMFLRAKGLEELRLRLVFCSGEALTYDLRGDFLKLVKSELHNLYGPTEAAVDVSAWDCREDVGNGIVPIGKPIANIQLFVLGADMQPVAPGATGELFIGGIGLARGYLNRPDLTASSFIPNPVQGAVGACLYKTGDLARFLPDGNVEFLGRIDHQVKINGQRIELGEIEATLREHAAVTNAVVMPKELNGTKILVAIVKRAAGDATAAPALADWLRSRLPAGMVPQSIHFVDDIPLTGSGKTDRKALLATL